MAFFSVIIATYNRADLIDKAVKSVLDQTFKDWELIIIDDGSTDKTGLKLKSLLFNPQIKYIYQENKGRSFARNKGINESNGKYICFLDSDDYYLENHLEEFHNLIQGTQDGNKTLFFCNTLEKVNGVITNFPPIHEKDNIHDTLFSQPIGAPRMCIKRDYIDKEQFDPQLSIGEDVDLWFRLLPFKLVTHHKYTQVFLTHPGRSVSSLKDFPIREDIRLKKLLIKNYPSISQKSRKEFFAYAYLRLARLFHRKKKIKSIFYCFRSLFVKPSEHLKEILFLIFSNLKP